MSSHDKDRITAYAKDPFEFRLIGGKGCPEGGGPNDTDHTSREQHPLWRPKLLRPILQVDVDDVEDQGVHTPIEVRRNGEFLEVVYGTDRVRRARIAKLNGFKTIKVPYVVVSFASDKELLKRVISENEHRDENTFADRAEMARMLKQFGATDEELRIAFRFETQNSVDNLLAYYNLDPSVQESINKGEIKQAQALQLVKLTREEQVPALEEARKVASANGGKVTTATVARVVGKRTGKKKLNGAAAPSVRFCKKMLSHEKANGLADGFAAGVRFRLGDLPEEEWKTVKGLTALMRAMYMTTKE